MDRSKLKQRIVGVLVLAALIAVVLPFLLDRGDPVPPRLQVEMPPLPEGESPPFPADTTVLEDATQIQDLTLLGRTDTVVETPSSPPHAPVSSPTVGALNPSPLPNSPPGPLEPAAWVVQLGSFTQEKNALTLRDKLRSQGFSAFVERTQENGKDVVRVRVGPEISHEQAQRVHARLSQEMKVKGVVLRYR